MKTKNTPESIDAFIAAVEHGYYKTKDGGEVFLLAWRDQDYFDPETEEFKNPSDSEITNRFYDKFKNVTLMIGSKSTDRYLLCYEVSHRRETKQIL